MPKKITVNVTVSKREPQNLSKGDTVEFHANEECDLYFTNPDVFGDSVHLAPGNTSVPVLGDGATTWNALSGSKRKASASAGNPNEIVVP
jgi:hypothetical protein